jgi:hypothetical protein
LKKNNNAIIGFVGLGVLYIFSILGFIYLIESFFKELMISLDVAPLINHIANRSINFLLFVTLTWILIGWIVKNQNKIEINIVKYLFLALGVYFLTQILIMLYSALGTSSFVKHYNESYKLYIEYSHNNIRFLPVIESLLGYLRFFVFTGLIYFKLRKI